MLGRIADDLYWLARYTERAESTARLLDVAYRMTLIPQDEAARRSVWSSTLEVTGCVAAFGEKHDRIERDGVIRFLAFDADNPSSIRSCLRAARENARGLRGTITTEMWESLNTAWLEIRDLDEAAAHRGGYRNLFDWVKERASLFHGVADSTMLRDDGYAFMRLGWYLERANNTARLLDAKYHVLLAGGIRDVGGAVDYYQWGAVLRSVAAFRAYHRIYSNVITPARVAELLVMRADMPRSLHACLDEIDDALAGLCGRRPYECRRLAGELRARIAFATMEEILRRGLHEFLVEFIARTAELGARIERDFMMLA